MKRLLILLTALATSLALGQGQLRTPAEAASEAAGGEEIGGSVSVLGVWGGAEQETFLSMVAPFEEATGIDVEYTGTRDLNAVLFTRVEGGNPPDLAICPGPARWHSSHGTARSWT